MVFEQAVLIVAHPLLFNRST